MIDSLLYLIANGLDIMFVIFLCARFEFCPRKSHLIVVKRIFSHLKGTLKYGLCYLRSHNFDLVGHSESDFIEYRVVKKVLVVCIVFLVIA